MKQVAGMLRLDMAAYREVAAFAQFGSDLDRATQAQLGRGQRLQEVLKQPQYQPLSLGEEVVSLFAATNGFADHIPVEDVSDWETALRRSIDSTNPEIIQDIEAKGEITPETEEELREAIGIFNRGWQV
jgi:F-type H+-transporting ATPase subunit alpha